MVYAQTRICQDFNRNKTHKVFCDFEIQKDHLIPTRRPELVLINNKKITCHFVWSCQSDEETAEHKVDMSSLEQSSKAWKKTWGIVGRVRREIETIQTTTLRSARILRRVPKTWEDVLLLRPLWKTASVSWREKIAKSEIVIKKLTSSKITLQKIVILIGASAYLTM